MDVGFDLDMTLIDSRPGIVASFAALTAETGVFVDAAVVCSRLGPKLEEELAHWFPADEIDAAADAYRRHYDRECRTGTTAMLGARELVEDVRTHGGRVVVVTAKSLALALVCLETVGIHADAVAGWCHGDEKAAALRDHGADVYVGDTAPDMEAARAAAAYAVGVTTGPHDAATLTRAGADVVVPDLCAARAAIALLAQW